MFKYPMIERANGAGWQAEEGLAAFCSFYNLFWSWYSFGGLEGLFQFLATPFIIYTCFDHSRAEHLFSSLFFYAGAGPRLHFFVFSTWTQRRVGRGRKRFQGSRGGEVESGWVVSTSEEAAGLGLWELCVCVCVCLYDNSWPGEG